MCIYIYVIVEIGREVQMMQTMFECGSKDSKASPRTLKSVAAMEKQQWTVWPEQVWMLATASSSALPATGWTNSMSYSNEASI